MVNQKNYPKILIYELNEVPRRVFDLYIEENPNSAFSFIAKNGIILNTITKDDGELHPWSTWPTVHRGVNNKIHNIRFINQDLIPSKKFKPVWEILTENNIDVGVFGSLQSFPPKLNKNYKFYLPDTFAPKPDAYPKELSYFQKLNLDLTNENKAISKGILKENIKDLIYLFFNGVVSKYSVLKVVAHMIKEKFNKNYKKRRSIIQNVLCFPIFYKYLNRDNPSFATYFTNHVAGMMHRYWRDLFPEDFSITSQYTDKFNSKSIFKAMDLADRNLKYLINLSHKKNYNLMIITSMGQASIDRGEYVDELIISHFEKFIIALGLNKNNYEMNPAMQPDYCISSIDYPSMCILRETIMNLRDSQNRTVFTEKYEPVGLKINLRIRKCKDTAKTKKVIFKGKRFHLEKFGFKLISRDIGTAYHVPEGLIALYGKEFVKYKINNDEIIDTTRICPTLLKLYGIKIPNYMNKPFLS